MALVLLIAPVAYSQTINPTVQPANNSQLVNTPTGVQNPVTPSDFQGTIAPSAEGAGTDQLAAPLSTPLPESINDIPILNSNGIAADGQSLSNESGYKKWRFSPILGVGYSYDNNIFITRTNPVGSQIMRITVGLSFNYGDYREQKGTFVKANYLGVGSLYAQAPAQNTYNYGYNLLAQYAWDKFRLLLDSRYIYFNGANVQVGQFVKSTTLDNSLHGFYQYSEKTDLDLALQQISNLYPSNLNSYVNQSKFGFLYKTTEKLKLGAQGVIGFNPAQDSPTRLFQILNARAQYDISGKLVAKATCGAMASEFTSGGAPLRVSPVFSVEGDYTPTANSTLALKLYRNLNNSAIYSTQDYLATGGTVTMTQNIHEHWSASLGVGYENDTYVAIAQGVSASRVDNYFFIRPSIGYKFLKFLEAMVYYQRSFNDSTYENFSWNDNQYGVEVRTAF